jgi:hypothetical protein
MGAFDVSGVMSFENKGALLHAKTANRT